MIAARVPQTPEKAVCTTSPSVDSSSTASPAGGLNSFAICVVGASSRHHERLLSREAFGVRRIPALWDFVCVFA